MERRESHVLVTLALMALAWHALAAPAFAQPIGTFRWQFNPYCNVVTLAVVQAGGVYALEGVDDQCGAGQAASASGTAFQNPDGSIGLGLNLVLTPGGAPSHVDVTIQLATLSGTWRDSAGASGAFVFTPGAGSGGTPRPTSSSVGAHAIDPAQVQRRVTGVCAGGQAFRAVNLDGSVICEPVVGQIAGVLAGQGLTGGGDTGDVTLAVSFAGPGTDTTVARSDHFERPGSFNTAIGQLALDAATLSGANNTAFGARALGATLTGSGNTGIGIDALGDNVGGVGNTAIGAGALEGLTAGNYNAFVGLYAGNDLESGNYNVAIGYNALGGLTTGSSNIAFGQQAGINVTTGSNNIFIGNTGVAADSGTVRIGNSQVTAVYMTGISGQTSSGGVNVFINGAGRLGTMTSSARFKRDIRPVDDARAIVQALRPVRFFYRPEYDGGDRASQFGLIAEEVEKVDRDLVVLDPTGAPETVRYHFLPTLLVAEVQRLERELTALRDALAATQQEVARLRGTPR